MEKRKIKIAIFSGSIPSSTFVEHLIKGIANNHEVLLFGVINKATSYTNNNIKIYQTPSSHIANFGLTLFRTLKFLLISPSHFFTIIKQAKSYPTVYEKWIWFSKFIPIALYKPDILHFQWARDLDFYDFFKTQLDMKIVVSLRGAHVNYTPITEPRIAALYRHIFPKVDAFHAVSDAISKEAQKYGAEQGKINVIHSPIPTAFFEQFTSFSKSSEKTIKLLSIGRFHWKKGFKYALDAIFLLKTKGYSIEYTIVGPDEMTETISFQIYQLKLNDNIKLMGSVKQNILQHEMKKHDILLLSSVEEGIANVVLEAMALGLPVVSTNCGGMSEVVKQNETGWLVPIRDSRAISEAIIGISEASENELQRITSNAHNLVKQEFNEAQVIRNFVNIYQEVMGD